MALFDRQLFPYTLEWPTGRASGRGIPRHTDMRVHPEAAARRNVQHTNTNTAAR